MSIKQEPMSLKKAPRTEIRGLHHVKEEHSSTLHLPCNKETCSPGSGYSHLDFFEKFLQMFFII